MQILKVLYSILIVLIMALSGFYFLANYTTVPLTEPKELEIESPEVSKKEFVSTSKAAVFEENLMFNHSNITYEISNSCSNKRKEKMIEAFEIFEQETKVISFVKGPPQNSDILVSCSKEEKKTGYNTYAAGEGGPSKIINTSLFKVIINGKIQLYKESSCDYPVVELHELSHVFGFDHVNNPKSIVYPTSRCDQRITPEMIELLGGLYSMEPLPEARIKKISAIKKGRYFDFNISVINGGLINIDSINLTLKDKSKDFKSFKLENISVGSTVTLKVKNVKLPSYNTKEITFILDDENKVKEFNEENNLRFAYID